MSRLRHQERTTPRFRFNLQPQEALDLLTRKYCFINNRRFKETIIDENTTEVLIRMAEALTAPQPKFGIWFYGKPGNGKTSVMRAFIQAVEELAHKDHFAFMGDYFKPKIRFFTAKQLAEMCNEKETQRSFNDICECWMLCLDDLGIEPVEIQSWGNIKTPMIDLLQIRYDLQLYTMVTTNIAPENIEGIYGARVADRCREMFVPIKFKGESFRFK